VDNLCLTVTLDDFREGETGHELDREPEKSATPRTRELPGVQGKELMEVPTRGSARLLLGQLRRADCASFHRCEPFSAIPEPRPTGLLEIYFRNFRKFLGFGGVK
jgi:hypothetical protein